MLYSGSVHRGSESGLDKEHVLHTELGLKEEWRGASQSDWL